MAWEENSCICLNMQLIAILSRIGVFFVSFRFFCSFLGEKTCSSTFFRHQALSYYNIIG